MAESLWLPPVSGRRGLTAAEGRAENAEVRRVRVNEMLTQALRTTKINELVGPVFRNRPYVPATHATAP